MKKWFLFRRITLQRGHVIYRHAQMSAFIEAHFADAALALFDKATMATRITLESRARKVLRQFRCDFTGHLVQNFGERSCCRTEWHGFELLFEEIPMRNYTPWMSIVSRRLSVVSGQ